MSSRTYRLVAALEQAILPRLFRFEWSGLENLPSSGGVLVVANHLSYAEPVFLDWTLIKAGRWPRFLAKHQLFKLPIIGTLGRRTHQIPVYRESRNASDALIHAAEALERGECVVIYPEGSVTRDPQLWPMTARTGAGRLAVATGVPVIPMAQWGAHEVMPGTSVTWPRLWPRKTIKMRMGEPIDLSNLDADKPERDATDRMMAALTALVAELRGELPPTKRWDRRVGKRV